MKMKWKWFWVTFTPNGKREFVQRGPSFPINCRLLFTISVYKKIRRLTPVLSIRIILDNFHLLVFYFEKFLTWISLIFTLQMKPVLLCLFVVLLTVMSLDVSDAGTCSSGCDTNLHNCLLGGGCTAENGCNGCVDNSLVCLAKCKRKREFYDKFFRNEDITE